MLKKGSSLLAQRARAASRLLESFVGAGTRLRVQRDEAFVLWDDMPFNDPNADLLPEPEWLRRTLCCARWETTQSSSAVLVAVAEPADATETGRADGVLVKAWLPRVGLKPFEVRATPGNVAAAAAETKAAATVVERERDAVVIPRVRGKLFDPKNDDAYYTDQQPPSPRAVRSKPIVPRKAGPAGLHAKREKETAEPVKVVRLLARGEKLDP